jgi:hypothetical protein
MSLVSALGYTIPFAFASGLNVYATIAVLGLSSHFGLVSLPQQFRAFDHPAVIGVARGDVPWSSSWPTKSHGSIRCGMRYIPSSVRSAAPS